MNIFLFPGQGSQAVGMGKDLAENSAHARERFEQANVLLGFDLAKICFDGPEEDLRQTRITQPALFVHSVALSELLAQSGVTAGAAAGHSLGEFSALTAAGALTFEEGLRLVKARAEAMQHAGEGTPGTMAAIVGLDDEKLLELCKAASTDGVVVPANFNSPGQVVISGAIPAVRKAVQIAPSMGAKLAKELNVSGAFHSPLMESAASAFSGALEAATINAPRFPVIANVTAKRHGDARSIKSLLREQLLSPVRWTDSLIELSANSDVTWFEIGSGNVLSGLLKRTIKGAAAKPVGTWADVQQILTTVSL